MTLVEVCLLAITVLMIALVGVLVWIVISLRATQRVLQDLARDTHESVRRIDEVGGELKSLIQRAGSDYRRVSDVAGSVLHEVVIPVQGAAAVIRGVRTGLTSLFRSLLHPSNSTKDTGRQP